MEGTFFLSGVLITLVFRKPLIWSVCVSEFQDVNECVSEMLSAMVLQWNLNMIRLVSAL